MVGALLVKDNNQHFTNIMLIMAVWARYAARHGYGFLHGDPGCTERRANWLKARRRLCPARCAAP